MKGMNRRRFLQVAGAGSIAMAAGTVPALPAVKELGAKSTKGTYSFRAVTGLSSKPLPTYATYVLEGHMNLDTRSGVVTKGVFAGAPEAKSLIALPGLSRIVRVTDVQNLGGTFRIKGMVDDRSQLMRGESPHFEMFIDPATQTVRTSFFGSAIELKLEG